MQKLSVATKRQRLVHPICFTASLVQPSKRIRQLLFALIFASPVILSAQVAQISVPRVIQFSGVLTDWQRKALSGTQGVIFAIYKDQQGGAPLWVETQNVHADDQGRYTVLLGSTQKEGVPLDLFSTDESRWLGTQVQTPEAEESPRMLLVSVPYALKAADAETLGGLSASAFLRADPQGQTNSLNAASAVTQQFASPRSIYQTVADNRSGQGTGSGNSGTVRAADQFAGSDAGTKISAAIADLPSTGGTVDASALEDAQTISADILSGIKKPIKLLLGAGTYNWSVDASIPANVTLEFSAGSQIRTTHSLTIKARIDNPYNQQIFSGTGSFKLDNSVNPVVYPEWWGAQANSSIDSKSAIDAAIASGKPVQLLPGTYNYAGTLRALNDNNRTMIGAGADITTIQFTDNSVTALVEFTGTTSFAHLFIQGLTFSGPGKTSGTNIHGFWSHDHASNPYDFRIDDVAVKNVSGTCFLIRDVFMQHWSNSWCENAHGNGHDLRGDQSLTFTNTGKWTNNVDGWGIWVHDGTPFIQGYNSSSVGNGARFGDTSPIDYSRPIIIGMNIEPVLSGGIGIQFEAGSNALFMAGVQLYCDGSCPKGVYWKSAMNSPGLQLQSVAFQGSGTWINKYFADGPGSPNHGNFISISDDLSSSGNSWFNNLSTSIIPSTTSFKVNRSIEAPGAQINGMAQFAGQIQSNVMTGTAPFAVASTTPVANLNADLLDGLHSSAFEVTVNKNAPNGYAALDASSKIGCAQLPALTGDTIIAPGSCATSNLHVITIPLDGYSSVIKMGPVNLFSNANYSCTIKKAMISADQPGSITVDIWKANATIPTSANTISASAPVVLSNAQLNQASPLTGWTTSVLPNDVFGASVRTVSTITRATIQLWCQ